MTIAAVVQARMGSRRLPGKSMLALWQDMPLLEVVLRRVLAARLVDQVVLATTDRPDDDRLATAAERLGVPVVRGSEVDVLGRFVAVLARHPAHAIVRICADNPFVDPEAVDDLIRFYELVQPCDYASNHTAASGLPDGIGTEIIAVGALHRTSAEAVSDHDREHVTAFVRERPDEFCVRFVPPPFPRWPFVSLDVDTERDLARMRRLASALCEREAPLWPFQSAMRVLGVGPVDEEPPQ